jgi:hypothetical protein
VGQNYLFEFVVARSASGIYTFRHIRFPVIWAGGPDSGAAHCLPTLVSSHMSTVQGRSLCQLLPSLCSTFCIMPQRACLLDGSLALLLTVGVPAATFTFSVKKTITYLDRSLANQVWSLATMMLGNQGCHSARGRGREGHGSTNLATGTCYEDGCQATDASSSK